MGLATQVVDDGQALAAAQALAQRDRRLPAALHAAPTGPRPTPNGTCRWPRRCSAKAPAASRWCRPKPWPVPRALPPVRGGTAVSAMTEPRHHPAPVFAGVTYHSLRDARVIVTGGAGGIGADIVRAFAAQGSQVGFVDLDVAAGTALAAATPNTFFEACDVRDVAALARRAGRAAAAPGRRGRAGQQRRQRPAPRHRRGHAGVLRRAHRAEPAAALLRHPGGAAVDARARRRRHRQHRLGQLAHEDAAAVGVRHRQVGDDRADTRAGARPGAARASASTASCPAG